MARCVVTFYVLPVTGASASEFKRYWNEWRTECDSKIALVSPQNAHLGTICQLLSGDLEALAKLKWVFYFRCDHVLALTSRPGRMPRLGTSSSLPSCFSQTHWRRCINSRPMHRFGLRIDSCVTLSIIQWAIEQFHADLGPYDRILLDVIDQEAHRVVVEARYGDVRHVLSYLRCSKLFRDDWWFATHLCDLLSAVNWMSETPLDCGVSLREVRPTTRATS